MLTRSTGIQGMINTFTRPLRYTRSFGERFFRAFGIHVATHQIRVILISCVVITSLFYPALALYSSSSLQYLSRLSIITSLASDQRSLNTPQDLVELWQGHHSFIVDSTASRLLCGIERTLRVERILIRRPFTEDDEVLDPPVLLSTLAFEDRLQEEISARGIPCLARRDKRCLALSPLAFWDYDRQKLSADTNVLQTLNSQKNISFEGISLTPSMVLAGHGLIGSTDFHFDHTSSLVLTYFVTESDCTGNAGHNAWMEAVHAVTSQTPFVYQSTPYLSEPNLISLQFEESSAKPKELKLISILTYSVYAVGLAYYTWAIRRMESKMHSTIGLSFTGLVEIAASTITSLSVCALVGFKVTLVPWELLPMILFFVGAENMMSLTEAVAKTSVTLPVKQRISEGLSRAGTSNTLKLVSYNTVLGLIAGFSTGAIQQFCAFAIVVLVAHWFLAHVFYVTVLSIDLQRLELDDLLRQDPSMVPSVPPLKMKGKPNSMPWWRNILLGGRASKNLNLVLLLAVTGLLYYTTYTPLTTHTDTPALKHPRTQWNLTDGDHSLPLQQTWNVLNPQRDPRLHLRIESPITLTFTHDATNARVAHERKHSARWLTVRTARAITWSLKIVALPISVTTGVLYMILLYLLKDAELLEAQRNRPEEDSPIDEEGSSLHGQVSFSTLPRVFSTDVYLIASSKDGRTMASVSMRREVAIWRMDTGTHVTFDTTSILSPIPSTSNVGPDVTSLAVDDDGGFIAIGADSAVLAVWSVSENSIQVVPIPALPAEIQRSKIAELQFVGPIASRKSLVIIFADGTVLKYPLQNKANPLRITPAEPGCVVRAAILHLQPSGMPLVAFFMDDGTFQLSALDTSECMLLFGQSFPAGSHTDLPLQLHACRLKIGGGERLVIGAATESGVVSLWDGQSGECIHIMDDRFGKINAFRISPTATETCQFCGELPLESFSIVFSVDFVVLCFKAFLKTQARHCTCTQNQPRSVLPTWDSPGRRSRASSISSANGSVVALSPFRPKSTGAESVIASFPVSGHGVHSRRASEKDSSRILPSALSLPLPTVDFLDGNSISPASENGRTLWSPSESSFWRNLSIYRQADMSCERGGWGVMGNNTLLGIRRRSRTPPPPATASRRNPSATPTHSRTNSASSSHGLSPATLERWEVWIYDPCTAQVQSSPLSMLASAELDQPAATTATISLGKSLTPRLPFTRVSPIVISSAHTFAGFGNTIGILQGPF